MFYKIKLAVLLALMNVVINGDTTEYSVSTKTGVGPGCGTDSTFNLTFIGADNNTVTFLLDGDGDRMETSHTDRFVFKGELVYPIDRLVLQRVLKRGWSPDWYIHWLTLDVNDTLYVFRINRWIRNDKIHEYYGTLGKCKQGYRRVQECQAPKSIL